MGGFKATFVNEIEKILKKKKAVAVVAISLLVIIIGQLIVAGVRSNLGLRGTSSMEFPLMVLSVFANTVLPLFSALIVIDAFTGEFSHNTMKISLVRPVTRLKVFSSKIAAAGVFILANLFIVMLLSIITGFVFNSAMFSLSGLGKIFISYLITFIPVMLLTLMTVLLANVLNSVSSAFFLSIILFMSMKVLGIVFPQYSSLFATSMLDWYKLWIADNIPMFKVLRQFFIMAGYSIMFFTASYYLFDKKDL